VVARGDILWAELREPMGRRPVCVLTRTVAIPVLDRVTVAAITRTVRGIRSEVPVGEDEGLHEPSVVNCDDLAVVPQRSLDPEPLGHLDEDKRLALDQALRFALDIRY